MRTSRLTSTSAARVSGEIFLVAILFVVLSEELVELLLDPHQREDDSPEVLAIDLVGHRRIVAARARPHKTLVGTCRVGSMVARTSDALT